MSSTSSDALRAYKNVEQSLAGLQPALESAQRLADLVARRMSPASQAVLGAVKAMEVDAASTWGPGLSAQLQEFAATISRSGIGALIGQIQKNFEPALEEFRVQLVSLLEDSYVIKIPAMEGSLTHSAEWQRLCRSISEMDVCPPPSVRLTRWMELSQQGIEPETEADLPDGEEVNTHWLAALLWVLILMALFGSAARAGQWKLAGDLLGHLANAVGIFLGLDWLLRKVMK